MSYLLKNPSAGNVYFNTSGTALSSTIQPKVKSGAAKGLGADQTLLDNSPQGKVRTVYGSTIINGAGRNIGSAFWSLSGTAITSVADNGSGFCRFTLNTHGLALNTVLNIQGATAATLNTIHNITAVPTGNTFDTDVAYVASGTAGSYFTVRGTFNAGLEKGHYVIVGVTSTLARSISKDVLSSPGGDFKVRRAIHQLEHVRHLRTATAIRTGYWNEYSASWSTAPTNADDISTFETNGVDNAANPSRAIPGELTIMRGNPVPHQADYQAKTN